MHSSSICKIKKSVYYSNFITITNTCDNQFIKEKGLFELTALEFESVVIWPYGLKKLQSKSALLKPSQEIRSRKEKEGARKREKDGVGRREREGEGDRRRERDQGPTISFEVIFPITQRPFSRLYLLKFTIANSINLDVKLLIHGSLWYIQHLNNSMKHSEEARLSWTMYQFCYLIDREICDRGLCLFIDQNKGGYKFPSMSFS